MIMCLKSINISGNQHVLAGCENGSVVLFDTRQANEELANIKLYTEPGTVISTIASCNEDCNMF